MMNVIILSLCLVICYSKFIGTQEEIIVGGVGREDNLRKLLVPGFRPPAVPLVVWDPYSSIWSFSSALTDSLTNHWSGKITNLIGMIRIDSKAYLFMGQDTWSSGAKVPTAKQVDVVVYPTRTVYTFEQDGIRLILTFATPAILTDIELWSLPITYVTYDVSSIDGKEHNVEIYYSNTGEVAINDVNEEISWSRSAVTVNGLTVLRVGSSAQDVLGASGDFQKINWGYYYVAVQNQPGLSSTMTDWTSSATAFVDGKPFPPDDTRMPRKCSDNWPVLSVSWNLGNVGSQTVSTKLLIAYDDIKSIRYFGTDLIPYWQKGGVTTANLIENSFSRYAAIIAQCVSFDTKIMSEMDQVGGPYFTTLNSLAYRQVTGACKVTWNAQINLPWVFMKEISSDGDVSTVDVIFPASPLFFYLNPEMLRLTLLPILAYANNETNIPYNLAWAPHHLGTWPICDLTPERQEQMPIEETGNMFMMLAKIYADQKNLGFLDKYWPLLKTWGDYLTQNLPDPPKQLCTDDFEGATAHNVNLAAKGIIGLGCYSYLLKAHGDNAAAAKYDTLISQYTQFWLSKAFENNHYKREYDQPGTWSLKYNLVYQKLLNLTIFPEQVFTTESSYYISQLHPYGVPLDDRHTFTLLEYMGAIQALLTTKEQSDSLIKAIYNWANETPDRVPLTDWYDAENGKLVGFRARPTVGDLFTKMLL